MRIEYKRRRYKEAFQLSTGDTCLPDSYEDERQGLLSTATDWIMCSVGVVRPIILAFRAEDRGSNPRPSTLLRNEVTEKEAQEGI